MLGRDTPRILDLSAINKLELLLIKAKVTLSSLPNANSVSTNKVQNGSIPGCPSQYEFLNNCYGRPSGT